MKPKYPHKLLRDFCRETLSLLVDSGPRFGEIYCAKVIELYRTFKYPCPKEFDIPAFGLFSAAHHSIFQNILDGLNGDDWDEKGEYGENFRQFIRYYRDQELPHDLQPAVGSFIATKTSCGMAGRK